MKMVRCLTGFELLGALAAARRLHPVPQCGGVEFAQHRTRAVVEHLQPVHRQRRAGEVRDGHS